MAVFNIFSKRKTIAEKNAADVFKYDAVPEKLRVQCVQIFDEAIGTEGMYQHKYDYVYTTQAYDGIVKILKREYGTFKLTKHGSYNDSSREQLIYFMLECRPEQFLDVIELAGQIIQHIGDQIDDRSHKNAELINEINIRFRENSYGYQYEDGIVVRVDNQFAHAEITKPALQILLAKHLKGAREEFLSAHENYRQRKYKEAISECHKAFESTMKSICVQRNWTVAPNATSKGLIDACFENKLIPIYMQAHFTSLRAMLEAGVPTTRNKTSGHGQGIVPLGVPDHFAALILHQTASIVIFLEKSNREL